MAKKKSNKKKASKKRTAKNSASKKSAKKKAAKVRPSPVTPVKDARARDAERKRAARQIGRQICIDPSTRDVDRHEACKFDFKLFCETYKRAAFPLDWSDDHLTAIERLQRAVLIAGLFAFAMPRGSGKTTLSDAGLEWATLYGHAHWAVVIGATQGAAEDILDGIKKELTYNPLFIEDFPHICQPIAALENETRRCEGQMYTVLGENEGPRKTEIGWTKQEIEFPSIDGDPAAGSIITARGLTGNIRGLRRTMITGEVIRPDLAMLDDPQTKESAASPTQTKKRVELLNSDILGLAGPGKEIAGMMPCTVIYPDDMADQMLDRKKNPQWMGHRCKLMRSMPTDLEAKESLWHKYRDIRAEDFEDGGDGSKATEFYKENQAAMDAGADHHWPARKSKKYHSAIEEAMVIYFERPDAFAAEYQNDPEEGSENHFDFRPETFREKMAETKRGRVMRDVAAITCHIDVQDKLLYWAVVAWRNNFSGVISDYGSWPDQKVRHFVYRSCAKTLKRKYSGGKKTAHIYQGLTALITFLCDQPWKDDDGHVNTIDRILVDSGDGEHQSTVFRVCREHPRKEILMPSRGIGIGAKRQPMSVWKKADGERKPGHHWRDRVDRDAGVRYLLMDSNYWKADLLRRCAMGQGAVDGIELYRADRLDHHQMIAEHLDSEKATLVEAEGRKVFEFTLPVSKPDNHLKDCLYGAAAAASHVGIATGQERSKRPRKPRKNSSTQDSRRSSRVQSFDW